MKSRKIFIPLITAIGASAVFPVTALAANNPGNYVEPIPVIYPIEPVRFEKKTVEELLSPDAYESTPENTVPDTSDLLHFFDESDETSPVIDVPDLLEDNSNTEEALYNSATIPDEEMYLCDIYPENVPNFLSGCRSSNITYMGYNKITAKSSPQYSLQRESLTTTDISTGVRTFDGRYMIAVGSAYADHIGQYLDLVFEDGTILPCITGDFKANIHTDPSNRFHSVDGSVAEFIIDYDYFSGPKQWKSIIGEGKIVKVVNTGYVLTGYEKRVVDTSTNVYREITNEYPDISLLPEAEPVIPPVPADTTVPSDPVYTEPVPDIPEDTEEEPVYENPEAQDPEPPVIPKPPVVPEIPVTPDPPVPVVPELPEMPELPEIPDIPVETEPSEEPTEPVEEQESSEVIEETEPAPEPVIEQPVSDLNLYSSDTLSRDALETYCLQAGTEFSVDPYVLEALCETESGLNVDAKNGQFIGLFQISPAYHTDRMESIGGTDLWDPQTNTRTAASFLADLYTDCNDMSYALMKYNMKAETADKMWKNGQVSAYAKTIMKRADELRGYGLMG